MAVEIWDATALPTAWDHEDMLASRSFGDLWLSENRSVVLVVPSVVAKPDYNAIINPNHPDARLLHVSAPEKVVWDKRLFKP